LIKYGVFLIVHIYLAGFSTISKIISGKINPDIVEIETTIEDNLYICILANSITLTPGTVTIDKEGRKLKVLWIDCVTKDSKEAGEMIKGKFEKFLLKG
jgi:multicomponent Na+:H+ antiporter subunit E